MLGDQAAALMQQRRSTLCDAAEAAAALKAPPPALPLRRSQTAIAANARCTRMPLGALAGHGSAEAIRSSGKAAESHAALRRLRARGSQPNEELQQRRQQRVQQPASAAACVIPATRQGQGPAWPEW